MAGINSFAGGSGFTITNPDFKENKEVITENTIPVGIKSPVSSKIEIQETPTIADGNVLSSLRSIEQDIDVTKDPEVRYSEVAFSPQNQVNADITSQLGYFNIGEYIGDIRQAETDTNSYPDLDKLRDDYFKKYTKSYNLQDFIRLIKFFDNSLFKMIKDFTPANVSMTSGVVVKQHILERNRLRRVKASSEDLLVTSSISIGNISAGAGGSVNRYQENIPKFSLTQSWEEIVETLDGPAVYKHTDESEFYNGIYGNPSQNDISYVDVINGFGGSDCSAYTNPTFEDTQVTPVFLSTTNFTEEEFLLNSTRPNRGIVWLWNDGVNVKHIKISNTSRNGVDISKELSLATQVPILLNNPSTNPIPPNLPKSNTGFYTWDIISRRNFDDYVYFEPNVLTSPSIVFSEDANIFDIEFDSTGDFNWLATASGTPVNPLRLTGIRESIPQGYFPTTPTFPREQFFRGWDGADYLIEPNTYTGGTGIVDDIIGNFDTGTGEVNTAHTSSDVAVYGRYTSSPITPWFMNAPQEMITYPSALITDLDPSAISRTIIITAIILTPITTDCSTLNNASSGATIAIRYEGNESLFATNAFGQLVVLEGTGGFTTVKDIKLESALDAGTAWTPSSIVTPASTTTTIASGIYGVNNLSAENGDSILIRIGDVNGQQGIKAISYCL